MIIQDKFGLHRVRWGEKLPGKTKLKEYITKKGDARRILNCLIYAELMDNEMKEIRDDHAEIWSYWEVTRERIVALHDALQEKLNEKKVA
jgi:hypothetical protein